MKKFNHKIKSNIKIPLNKRKSGYGIYFKLMQEMNIGDSVLLPIQDQASSCITAFRRYGGKAVTRSVENGWRVWRIK